MPLRLPKTLFVILGLFLVSIALIPPSAQAAPLAFSSTHLLATLSWADETHLGVPAQGVDGLAVDNQGRFWLQTDRDFSLFSPRGKFIETVSPMDPNANFYGFAGMEARPGGGLILLERLETPLEQLEKMNTELNSRPGARLIEMDDKGKRLSAKEEFDPGQPHSSYVLENGEVYSLHEDGTYLRLDPPGPAPDDKILAVFAEGAEVARWNRNVKTLPGYHAESRFYHDVFGHLLVDKAAKFTLDGKPFVEGLGPLAERRGLIYYRVCCYPGNQLADWVFVENPLHGQNTLVGGPVLAEGLNLTEDHAFFVDAKGNIYEGVAKRDGFQIYEWKKF
jgi:hypothetical protein